MAVRLKDVARESGVSISTVSRILNRDTSKKSSASTVKKVFVIAEQLGYIDHPEEQKKAYTVLTKKKYDIACILTSEHETYAFPFFARLLAGIQKEISGSGKIVHHTFSVFNLHEEGFADSLESAHLDGGIMLGRMSAENLELLKKNIPHLVYAGVNTTGNTIDEVVCSGYEGTGCAVDYLLSLGHTNIGFIGPTQKGKRLINEHRYMGFLNALKRNGISLVESFVRDTDLTSSDGYQSAVQLISNKKLPTAIFCANDTIALGVMRAFCDHSIRIPDDISIIGFDNIDVSAYLKPALTTIAVPIMELGRLAVKIILDKIEAGRTYPLKVDVPFELIVRESCRALNKKRDSV